MRPVESVIRWVRLLAPFALIILVLFISVLRLVDAPRSMVWFTNTVQVDAKPEAQSMRLLRGKVASLNWIVGRDCQAGIRAYLQTAVVNPDAALVGGGWLDANTGELIDGQSNNCTPGTLSMDAVVEMVHQHGGMAYLTVTMLTDGSAGAWTPRQQSNYIAQAAMGRGAIDPIVREVKRANYDGVIMDLEAADPAYPSIQQRFAAYNQRLWEALRPLHKLYGIALVHKVSDHDEYYYLNGFQDWRLLAHSADFLVVMALDQSYAIPGPTVSLPWLKQLLAYTLLTMPDMLPRVVWELPLYGASWHLAGNKWVFDGGVTYQEAQTLAARVASSQIDRAASDLNDATAAHLVYTDAGGVKHALWYHTARNLYTIITAFRQVLEQTPQFGGAHLQIAVWYRATWEPGELWPLLSAGLPN